MNEKPHIELPSGIFTISLDFELIWGTLDKPKHSRFFAAFAAIEREQVIMTGCSRSLPNTASAPPGAPSYICSSTRIAIKAFTSTEADAPIFYGRDLIRKRSAAARRRRKSAATPPLHHRIFDDPSCTLRWPRRSWPPAIRAASEIGLRMTSFAFHESHRSSRFAA